MARGWGNRHGQAFVSASSGFVLGLPVGACCWHVTARGRSSPITRCIKSCPAGEHLPFHPVHYPAGLMIPFTRMIVGTSIGLQAAIVPLTVGAAPFIARMVENALLEIPSGLVERRAPWAPRRCRSSRKCCCRKPCRASVNAATITLITWVGYSAMGGAVGAGGLGQIGYQYGYIGYNATVMNTVLVLLVVLVYLIQFCGDRIVKAVTHK
ncbi:methionine ABC transporter permease MetI [Serratia marcescens]|uniref:Methionine ABC transporter permease MetI n=1 Tax=Serratia marcescens TaxID=615 RepID=A0A939NSS4_SERMA|nr:methionine ABC transporter permease MetI [Serratia marcescens]